MQITVYSASSGQVPQTYIKAAHELGRLIALGGHTLVNGAGRTGLMGLVPMLALPMAARLWA